MLKVILVIGFLGMAFRVSAQLVYPLVDFEGVSLPKNGDGNFYPEQYSGSGTGTVSQDNDAMSGTKSVMLSLTAGKAYAQFNPYNYGGLKTGVTSPRGFAREYADNPIGWQYNTINRFTFWIKCPTNAGALYTNGKGNNMEFGTYVKQVNNADNSSDEAGGNHYYHFMNIAPTDTWTKVIMNMHPSHQRGGSGNTEWGYQPYPTCSTSKLPDGTLLGGGSAADCGQYNYFDAFTRFYIEFTDAPTSYPAYYKFDGLNFYQEQNQENDSMIYTIAATYVQSSNRVILTWSRIKSDNTVNHEVRYAFQDIHQIGWNAAIAAPSGIITPPGWQGYNCMLYDNSTLPLSGQSTLYLAIKPQNSNIFSQISLPLNGSTGVNEPEESINSTLSVFPNPLEENSNLNIYFNVNYRSEANMKIMNTNGQLIYNEIRKNFIGGYKNVIPLQLSSGLYVLQIITDKEVVTRKIVIQ